MKKLWENIKAFKNLVKQLWGNPRTRAMIILTLYFFLFLFLITSIRMRPNTKKQQPEKETQEKVEMENNYEYNIGISYQNATGKINHTLSGTRYQEKQLLRVQNSLVPYYVQADGIYQNIDGVVTKLDLNYGINLYQLTPRWIQTLIEKASLESTVEFEDGNQYLYRIPLHEFLIVYQGTSDVTETIQPVFVQVEEKDGIIQNVKLDLTTYYQLIDPTTTEYMITITYTNIGKVKNFDINL